MVDLLELAKLITYVWAFGEVALSAHLYFYAYKGSKGSRILLSLFMLLSAVAVTLAMRLVYVYTTHILGQHTEVLRHLLILPNLFIVIAANNFRKQSTRIEDRVESVLDVENSKEEK